LSDNALPTVNASHIVTSCCAKSIHCQFCLLDTGESAIARFHELANGRLILHVTTCERDDAFRLESECYVTFPFEESLYSFVAAIKDVRATGASLEVILAAPLKLTVANRRQSFRVPIVQPTDLQVEMRLADGTRIPGAALKLSECGIEVDLKSDDDRLPLDSEVQFELRYRNDHVEVPATVRRRHQTRRALTFSWITIKDSRQSVASLQRMVRTLEKVWLRNRLA
jgi:c-di-GMP-binding flagellar brake protein YcgR